MYPTVVRDLMTRSDTMEKAVVVQTHHAFTDYDHFPLQWQPFQRAALTPALLHPVLLY
jgi:hypothetical protein